MKLRYVPSVILIGLLVVCASCTRTESSGVIVDVLVEYVEGDVTIDDKPAVAGQKLEANFTVQTGDSSYCAIVFNKRNIMHIDAGSFAVIDLGKTIKEVKLERGVFASALRNIEKSIDGDRFVVTTPTAVAGVRGTVFFVKVENEESSYICTCNGILHINDADGDNDQMVASAHHTAFRYLARDGDIDTEGATMLYHTDEMMELGASRIGESIDWSTVGP